MRQSVPVPQRHLEAVVFDLIFTLIHPGEFPGGGDRTTWLAGLLGVAEADLQPLWDEFETDLESGKASEVAPFGPELTWVVQVAAKLGRPIEFPTLKRIEKDWDLTRRLALLTPDEDAVDALVALRSAGLKIGVLSNTHALELQAWSRSPLARLVDVVVLSHEIKAMKPAGVAYEAVLSGLGVESGSCAYVGDGSSDELLGARRAGFALVVLASKYSEKFASSRVLSLKAQADIAVESLSDLPLVLLRPID